MIGNRLRWILPTLAIITAWMAAGCRGYQCGTTGLYNREIKTVFVPMIAADSYRSGLGERLTESVCKKITERTPYDLAGPDKADSELVVQLVSDSQTVSELNRYNDTRQKTLNWSIVVQWKDKRGYVLGELEPIALSGDPATTNAQGYLVAEMGQSTATAEQEVIDKLSDQIVGLMETTW